MSKISADLIEEVENRASSDTVKEIAISLLGQIGENSSDENLRTTIKRKVDIAVREEEQ